MITEEFSCPCDTIAKPRVINLGSLTNDLSSADGSFVEVEGIYVYEYERSSIGKKGIKSSDEKSIWIDFNNSDSVFGTSDKKYFISLEDGLNKCNRKRIRVRGILDMKSHGHLDLYFATINCIS